MSRPSHPNRQTAFAPRQSPRHTTFGPRSSWAWSGVVLLSTLLLSPVASANFLSAIARALPHWAAPAALPTQQSLPPRRAESDGEAARVLLQSVLENTSETAEETDAPRPEQAQPARGRASFVPSASFADVPLRFPADGGDTPAPACVRLRVPRAPPLV